MNKIKVKNNCITLLETDELIDVSLSDKLEIFDISKMKIKVLKDTALVIEYENKDEAKIDIEYSICSNVNFEVTEIRKENKTKIQYKYYIEENSCVNSTKFYDCNNVKELDIINLNGRNAKINYNFKTIAKDEQKYDIVIYHNNLDTESNLINHGVNIENGNIIFNVTGVVYNQITGCTVNQNNRIITFNDNKCEINPNLLIEDNDVIANHSALIGKFSDAEIFYLQRLGISKEDSIKLLIKGFLSEGTDNKIITKIIDKYWR